MRLLMPGTGAFPLHRGPSHFYDDDRAVTPLIQPLPGGCPVRRAQSLADILDAVAWAAGVHISDLVGPSRFRPLPRIRFAYYSLAREFTGLSYSVIGKSIGGRDHSTVISGIEHAARDREVMGLMALVRSQILVVPS